MNKQELLQELKNLTFSSISDKVSLAKSMIVDFVVSSDGDLKIWYEKCIESSIPVVEKSRPINPVIPIATGESIKSKFNFTKPANQDVLLEKKEEPSIIVGTEDNISSEEI